LSLKIEGMLTVPSIKINEDEPLLVKTIITQEFLKKGYLTSNLLFLSTAHSKEVISNYADEFRLVGYKIKKAIERNCLAELLDGPVCHSGFERLT